MLTPETLDLSRRAGLTKLVLQTVHSCNLRCTYCISDAGRWGKNEESVMPIEIAEKTVERFADLYGKIKVIYFFGGEPALYPKIIDYVGLKCIDLVKKGKLKSLPTLGLTTNGTILTHEFLEVIEKHNVVVNVSIDGPPEIHNKLRKRVDGSGTYSQVINNIKKLRETTGNPKLLEMTYTLDHLNSELTLWQMMKFLHKETGVNCFNVMPAMNVSYTNEKFDPSSPELKKRAIAQYVEAVKGTLYEMVNAQNPTILIKVITIMRNFAASDVIEACPAGRRYFSVAWNGDIYPCQNIPETKNHLISNINRAGLLDDLMKSDVVSKILQANFNADKVLSGKWYKKFCRICPADNMSETGTLTDYTPFRHDLDATLAHTIVESLSPIAMDATNYDALIKRCRDLTEDIVMDED